MVIKGNIKNDYWQGKTNTGTKYTKYPYSCNCGKKGIISVPSNKNVETNFDGSLALAMCPNCEPKRMAEKGYLW